MMTFHHENDNAAVSGLQQILTDLVILAEWCSKINRSSISYMAKLFITLVIIGISQRTNWMYNVIIQFYSDKLVSGWVECLAATYCEGHALRNLYAAIYLCNVIIKHDIGVFSTDRAIFEHQLLKRWIWKWHLEMFNLYMLLCSHSLTCFHRLFDKTTYTR